MWAQEGTGIAPETPGTGLQRSTEASPQRSSNTPKAHRPTEIVPWRQRGHGACTLMQNGAACQFLPKTPNSYACAPSASWCFTLQQHPNCVSGFITGNLYGLVLLHAKLTALLSSVTHALTKH